MKELLRALKCSNSVCECIREKCQYCNIEELPDELAVLAECEKDGKPCTYNCDFERIASDVADFLDNLLDGFKSYCNECADTLSELKAKCLESNNVDTLSAYSYFEKRELMFRYEIPSVLEQYLESLDKKNGEE